MLAPLGFAVFPVAVGFAVLRYRMYEIDRIINRTVVYAIVTALLAGLYFGIVIGLQAAFGGLARGNDLAIAGSTLAVAALFRPARTRIQEFVDRRFYRRRYDAQQTLTAFSARLRDEVDLDQVASDLGAVVERHDAAGARLALAEEAAVTSANAWNRVLAWAACTISALLFLWRRSRCSSCLPPTRRTSGNDVL